MFIVNLNIGSIFGDELLQNPLGEMDIQEAARNLFCLLVRYKHAQFFMQFTQNESCGKCTLCREGTKQMLSMLNQITEGEERYHTPDWVTDGIEPDVLPVIDKMGGELDLSKSSYEDLGRYVEIVVKTMNHNGSYQHQYNDALVKLHLTAVSFAKDTGMYDKLVENDVKTTEFMMKRIGSARFCKRYVIGLKCKRRIGLQAISITY